MPAYFASCFLTIHDDVTLSHLFGPRLVPLPLVIRLGEGALARDMYIQELRNEEMNPSKNEPGGRSRWYCSQSSELKRLNAQLRS
jgi:hypothetical protein